MHFAGTPFVDGEHDFAEVDEDAEYTSTRSDSVCLVSSVNLAESQRLGQMLVKCTRDWTSLCSPYYLHVYLLISHGPLCPSSAPIIICLFVLMYVYAHHQEDINQSQETDQHAGQL